MDVFSELKEWALIFLKNRDVIQKSISGFDDVDGGFIVHKSSGDISFLVFPVLSEEVIGRLEGSGGLVVLNVKKNVDFVVSHWDKFSVLKGLCIYFVNPPLNEKWLLYPYTHNSITERSALKRGLESLFSVVPAYSQ